MNAAAELKRAGHITSAAGLMRAIESPQGFDPMPRSQHAWMMDRGEPATTRFMGMVFAHTIQPNSAGKWAAYARNDQGPITYKHIAATYKWTTQNTLTVQKRLEAQRRIRVDEQDRIWLSGKANQPDFAIGEEEANKDAEQCELCGETAANCFCTKTIPAPFLLYLQGLDPKEAAQGARRFLQRRARWQKHKADAMALLRAEEEADYQEVYQEFGFKDEESRGRPRKPRPDVTVKVIILEPEVVSVQKQAEKSADTSVQNGAATSEHNSDPGVHNPHPLRADKKIKVSKSEPPSPPDDLPTSPESPVVEWIEKQFGRLLDAKRTEAADLPEDHGIPAASVIRAAADKLKTKDRQRYPINSPGAFVDFLKRDLDGWIRRNPQLVEIDRQFERSTERPPAETPPASPLHQTSAEIEAEVRAELDKLPRGKAKGAGTT